MMNRHPENGTSRHIPEQASKEMNTAEQITLVDQLCRAIEGEREETSQSLPPAA
jgi:hypothetical protein